MKHLFALIVLISIHPQAFAEDPEENTVIEDSATEDPVMTQDQFDSQYAKLMKDLDRLVIKQPEIKDLIKNQN